MKHINIISCIIIGVILMGVSFTIGRFTFYNKMVQVLNVNRFDVIYKLSDQYYISVDKKIKVVLTNYLLRDEESYCKLKISNHSEPYYGNVVERYSEVVGTFSSNESEIPIEYVSNDDRTYIVDGNDTIQLTWVDTN